MKPAARWVLVSAAALLLGGCAQNLPPVPPSLELPKPVTDFRAVRKADKVYLRWTLPELTTDGQKIRNLGPVRICRTVASEMKECGPPVGQVSPVAVAPDNASPSTKAAPTRIEGRYIDTLPLEILQQVPPSTVTYAVEV